MKKIRFVKRTQEHGCLDLKQTETPIFLSSHSDYKYNACSCVSSYIWGKILLNAEGYMNKKKKPEDNSYQKC